MEEVEKVAAATAAEQFQKLLEQNEAIKSTLAEAMDERMAGLGQTFSLLRREMTDAERKVEARETELMDDAETKFSETVESGKARKNQRRRRRLMKWANECQGLKVGMPIGAGTVHQIHPNTDHFTVFIRHPGG